MPTLFIVHFHRMMLVETVLIRKRLLEDSISGWARILYHIGVAALSAAIALSLPRVLNFIAKEVLVYWSILGNEKLLMVSIEMAVAIVLVIFFNVVGRSWRDRKLSNMARDAGLVLVKPAKGFFPRRRTKKFKEKQGFAKDVLVIGSTGFRTFVDPKGDLHHVMQNCRMAKIMLLNPFSEGARVRAQSILDPHVTPETFQEQIKRSVAFLKVLKAVKKEVKLKLYQETPLLKLAILDDYIWIQHYQAGQDIQRLPEYIFKHDPYLRSLYSPFYQYFMTRWNDPNVPEYDLEADMLIYRDIAGNEIKREKYNGVAEIASLNARDHLVPKDVHGYPFDTVVYPLRQNRRALICIQDGFKNVW